MSVIDGFEITGDPVVIAFDALPDLARVLGIGQSQIDLVSEPFDGYVYAIRPGVPIFEAVRWPANDRYEDEEAIADRVFGGNRPERTNPSQTL